MKSVRFLVTIQNNDEMRYIKNFNIGFCKMQIENLYDKSYEAKDSRIKPV